MPTVGRLRYLEAVPPGGSSSSARGASKPRTLILIHGFPLNARMWEPQLALADAGWRIVMPELRGMDGGDSDPETQSMDDYAGDVIDLIDALHIEDAVIGGLSMGGYVAFAMLRHAPQYLAGMVLADTRPQADTPEAIEGRKRMLGLAQSKGSLAVLEEMLPKLIGETTKRNRPEIADRLREIAKTNSATAVAGAIRALMSRQDSTPLLSSIHFPTLILVGEEDTLTVPQVSQEMHRAIPGSELTVLPGVGHMSNLEAPRAFNAAMTSFLTHRV